MGKFPKIHNKKFQGYGGWKLTEEQQAEVEAVRKAKIKKVTDNALHILKSLGEPPQSFQTLEVEFTGTLPELLNHLLKPPGKK